MNPTDSVPLPAVADLRVVELGVWVAAPAAAGVLADWGADVIKVEAPGGDPMRNVFGAIGIEQEMPNPAYALNNRGNRPAARHRARTMTLPFGVSRATPPRPGS